ncbi:MAG: hypothetical protein UU82_C0034G0007 [Candidatus Nomurabacteria bacterium GW2011_GWC2_41_8]|uniref:DUF1616 domain-containing protein n=2 Tax=Candidatus Nomuraibacteriota TaxID=1752729 RepID=A0A1F6YAV7_9BACT|nr:MAG: hypothetical protein UU82_C0034G0007 [Candidatus Nomurabacteria bacterium GW2011_GWC2_41_8]OGI84750.1 MAG: hypothetical protein A3F49_02770 [Candidatus Nomurabacteria bacterium RIFCSPHIGHO2_12_FULL_42_19]OGI93616.1 MAG: hypothetical protein A3A07_01140 [Candidatus Nomurabacteria bacterium RIFCSPLOWO2_01_FULL_41_52]OGI99321.1 MAG: hypothetical protein A3H56_03605 [Candidatus Nomurabacteria bacterium RIFCSPLOWO2_02_FULL_42_24]OGJ03460.1 MAG: hypothetical protein A3F97_03315 [Candidatus No
MMVNIMLKVNFFHICENAILESGTNNVSLINIFENINANNFPAIHPVLRIVVGLENKNPGIYDVELVFLDEKAEILKIPAKVTIGTNGKGNWVHKIISYPIPRELTHQIKLNYEGKTIYTGYLTINNK